ncbi:MAG: hypothetical protein KBD51_02905 [Candidatus Levybacteria bacterium]|nr:hypothetical protein [Candidatus Levybacteria bacterium]
MSLNPLAIFRYKKLLLIPVLTFLILIPIIFYLLSNRGINKNDELTLLKKESDQIVYIYPDAINPSRVEEKFAILEDKKNTNEARYSALDNLAFFYGSAYSDTNNPRIKKYLLDLGKYGEKEFPTLYKKGPFNPVCQDTTCAPATPEEIKSIISQIKSSDMPKEDMERINKNLANASMVENDAQDFKFYVYNQTYTEIKNIADASSSSALLKAHEDLGLFLAKTYPDLWELYSEELDGSLTENK